MDSSDGEQDSEWMAILGIDSAATTNPAAAAGNQYHQKRQKLEGRRNRFDVHVSPFVRRRSTSVFSGANAENLMTYGNRAGGGRRTGPGSPGLYAKIRVFRGRA